MRPARSGSATTTAASSRESTPVPTRLTRVRSGGVGASWIAVHGNDVWVSNSKSGSVSRIDAGTRKLVSTVRVGISPVNLEVVGGDV
jgi:YVTN family beta-propeller protein